MTSLRPLLLAAALFAAVTAPVRAADDTAGYKDDQPPPTNKLERFHMKRVNCAWTEEMGKAMYECLKANFNMNAHWCHNETMELFCGKEDGAADATPTAGAPAAR
ncbi:MAG: hypothetical protein MUF30_10585 [Burkholderiales bacterium]|jgi:hypothetical protein|nr:hypothetical protein [Burkholderiales bacterium]